MNEFAFQNAMNRLPDDILLDALPPSWRPNGGSVPEEKSSAISRFFSSGWVAACLSVVVAVGVIAAIVLAGRGGADDPAIDPPAGTNGESVSDSLLAETDGETEPAGPGPDSTDPYHHPLNSIVRMEVVADGVSTSLKWGHIYDAYLSRSPDDQSGAPEGVWAFEFPPIDGYYLSVLAADPILPTVYTSSPDAISWKQNWTDCDSVSLGLHSVYNEDFERDMTPFRELPNGIYYFVFKLRVEGGAHRIGDAVYLSRNQGRYATYHVPCRVVIGDVDFTPPAKTPTPPSLEGRVQTEFSENCFSSNGDGTCAFTLRGYQRERILQIPAVSPAGDRVTVIEACRPSLLGSTVILPDSVTEIKSRAFAGSPALETVVLGEHVRHIGTEAFRECHGLVSVTLGDRLESIGADAFAQCSRLESVRLPDSVLSIGANVFRSCYKLKEVVLSRQLTAIGSSAFADCRSLVEIAIPARVQVIERAAFEDCSALVRVTMEEGLLRIEEKAFNQCMALRELNLPSTVTYIGDAAFRWCGLSALTLPDALTHLGADAFSGSELASIRIPAGITAIPQGAFQNCKKLTAVTIPNHVTSIGYYAFENSGLTSITLPASVKKIGWMAFERCEQLLSVRIEGAIELADRAFAACDRLQTVTLNEGLLSIGDRAFAYCPQLSPVTIPSSVTTFGEAVFEDSGTAAER